MALVGVELETLVSETDALTTRPPPFQLFESRPKLILTVHMTNQYLQVLQGFFVLVVFPAGKTTSGAEGTRTSLIK